MEAHWRAIFTHGIFHIFDPAFHWLDAFRRATQYEKWDELHKVRFLHLLLLRLLLLLLLLLPLLLGLLLLLPLFLLSYTFLLSDRGSLTHSLSHPFTQAVLDIFGAAFVALGKLVIALPLVVIFAPVLLVWVTAMYIFIENKLFVIPAVTGAVLSFGYEPPTLPPDLLGTETEYGGGLGGAAATSELARAGVPAFDEQDLSYVFNATLVFRWVFSTLPHLTTTVINTVLLYEEMDGSLAVFTPELIFTVSASLVLLISQLWPIIYAIRVQGSFMAAMRNRVSYINILANLVEEITELLFKVSILAPIIVLFGSLDAHCRA